MELKKLGLAVLITSLIAPTVIASQTKPQPNSKMGYFTAYNRTDREVTIAVGNWFPTEYTIGPRNSRNIAVSTDNQNIQIIGIR
ncbi:MAG: hypothetical protein ACYCQI_01065 [Gammaproteobacteria bacterium]